MSNHKLIDFMKMRMMMDLYFKDQKHKAMDKEGSSDGTKSQQRKKHLNLHTQHGHHPNNY